MYLNVIVGLYYTESHIVTKDSVGQFFSIHLFCERRFIFRQTFATCQCSITLNFGRKIERA